MLQVQPGHKDDVIQADFLIVRLADRTSQERIESEPPVPYETISYTWGDSTASDDILIGGDRLRAPASAIQVLRGLRSPTVSKKFWIDAICINQDDSDERAQQVAMMGDLYMDSTRTVIWLGQETAFTAPALDFCRRLVAEVDAWLWVRGRVRTDRWESIRLNLSHDEIESNFQLLRESINHVWHIQRPDVELMNDIFRRPWYKRQWVFQEVILSRRCVVRVGQHWVEWMDIIILALWILALEQRQLLYHPANFSTLPLTIISVQLSFAIIPGVLTNGSPLSVLMALGSLGLQARIPHDKIYALLSMTNWALADQRLPPLVQPDYRKPLHECMRDATRAMLLVDRNLASLKHPRLPCEGGNSTHRPGPEWPSWVPVWHASWPDILDIGTGLSNQYAADASEQMCLDLIDTPQNPEVLTLRGLKVGTIKHVTNPVQMFHGAGAKLAVPATWRDDVALSQSELCMLMTTEMYGDDRFTIEDADLSAMHRARQFHLNVQSTHVRRGDLYSIRSQEPYERTRGDFMKLRNSMSKMRNRLVFAVLTHAGAGVRVGLGPANLQRGDIVAVLFGAVTPFVLRPVAHRWELIGPCYVQGVMDGEAVREWQADANEWPADVFRLV